MSRSARFLQALEPADQLVLVSHVNPDPDALASMLGIEALVRSRLRGLPVVKTLEGLIARAENQLMVEALGMDLVPLGEVAFTPDTAIVMVDAQPGPGRCQALPVPLRAVLDHHETPGDVSGVRFRDIRPNLGATTTLVTGYLLEQDVNPTPNLATALLYGIESEISGYPREAGQADDGALVWLFPRADKDLLARIRHPRLPQSYFATFEVALSNATLFGDVLISWCGLVPNPEIVAEVADFFIRFDQIAWALAVGQFDGTLKLSLRSDHIGSACGDVLRGALEGMGTGGGHDKRAGGMIPLADDNPKAVLKQVEILRERFTAHLAVRARRGRRLIPQDPE